ncbi:MAG TPA: hypothetical protein VGA67_03380 [Candidatus Dojkabacteria bacterium]
MKNNKIFIFSIITLMVLTISGFVIINLKKTDNSQLINEALSNSVNFYNEHIILNGEIRGFVNDKEFTIEIEVKIKDGDSISKFLVGDNEIIVTRIDEIFYYSNDEETWFTLESQREYQPIEAPEILSIFEEVSEKSYGDFIELTNVDCKDCVAIQPKDKENITIIIDSDERIIKEISTTEDSGSSRFEIFYENFEISKPGNVTTVKTIEELQEIIF